MFKRKDDIKTFVVIVIVCFLCIMIALFFNNNNYYDKIKKVDDYDQFFTNVSIINKYLSYVASGDNVAIDSLLDKKYKGNSIFDSSNYSSLSSFEVFSMDYVQINDDFVYYVQGKIYNSGYDSVRELIDDDFKIVIIKDVSKNTFSLYPVYDNVKDVINGIKFIRIKDNEYNDLGETVNIDNEDVCVTYFSDYINYVYNDIDYAYELISDDMKKIYTDKNKYVNYIYDNFSSLSSTADKCGFNVSNNQNIYTIIDTNGNIYKFIENSIMNYKVEFSLIENN